jgi:hypothetical protein
MENNILPNDVIEDVRAEGVGIDFGYVNLKISLRNGNPRWDISRSRSKVDDRTPKGIEAVTSQKTGGKK